MTIILTHVEHDKEYLLINAPKPEGDDSRVCVCDNSGLIEWLPAEQVKVISVDGISLQDQLYKARDHIYKRKGRS